MTTIERTLPHDRHDVWGALVDPTTYPSWLIGADAIREIDGDWPDPGSAFHHRVGVGPLKVRDRSRVVAIEPEVRLVLDIRASALIQAKVTFELAALDDATRLRFTEEPEVVILGDVLRPVADLLTRGRNHGSLDRLERFLAERA